MLGGGSSSIFSRALAAEVSRSSAASITIAGHGLMDGVTVSKSPSGADLVDADVPGQAARRSLQHALASASRDGSRPR